MMDFVLSPKNVERSKNVVGTGTLHSGSPRVTIKMSMKRSDIIFAVAKVPVDFVMLLVAAIVAYWLRISSPVEAVRPVLFSASLPLPRYLVIAAVVAVAWLAVFALIGLYRITVRTRLWEEFTHIVIGVSAGEMLLIGFLFFRGEPVESRFLVLAVWFLAIVFVAVGRFIVRAVQRHVVGRYDVGVHRVLLIGDDETAQAVEREVRLHPDIGYRIVDHVSLLDSAHVHERIDHGNIDDVILATPLYDRESMLSLVEYCEAARVGFRYVPNLLQASTMNVRLDTFGGVPLVEVRRTSLEGWGKVWKRLFDSMVSAVLLVLLSPLFLIVAIIITLDSSGPVFVQLERVAQGKTFHMLKFRSMMENAHKMKEDLMDRNERGDGPLFKLRNDPRVTRVGQWLRRYRIDELPQLWNVLRGAMSLVGPRPHEPEEVARYSRHHKKVLLIKPGITGLAQVAGASDLPFEEEVKLDTYYIENWSLWMDIWLLMKTALVVVRPHDTA